MAALSPKAGEILDAAEKRARAGGYHGFSFRDLAADTGISSASVHHHFPSKEALMTALLRRYVGRFLDGAAAMPSGRDRICAYRLAFRESYRRAGTPCLCGVVGAEAAALPPLVAAGAREALQAMVADLATGLGNTVLAPTTTAQAMMAQLQGAMMLARAFDDVSVFDDATRDLARQYTAAQQPSAQEGLRDL